MTGSIYLSEGNESDIEAIAAHSLAIEFTNLEISSGEACMPRMYSIKSISFLYLLDSKFGDL